MSIRQSFRAVSHVSGTFLPSSTRPRVLTPACLCIPFRRKRIACRRRRGLAYPSRVLPTVVLPYNDRGCVSTDGRSNVPSHGHTFPRLERGITWIPSIDFECGIAVSESQIARGTTGASVLRRSSILPPLNRLFPVSRRFAFSISRMYRCILMHWPVLLCSFALSVPEGPGFLGFARCTFWFRCHPHAAGSRSYVTTASFHTFTHDLRSVHVYHQSPFYIPMSG